MELPLTDKLTDRQRDALYAYSPASQKNLGTPWLKDPTYFQTVRISSVALIKMTMHARSGGSLEVMGMMQGYIEGTTIVITDAFRLPVEGTETRVNAASDADEFLIEYLSACRDESRQENVVGWYHSHPGYGCWLSGIDVETQKLQQMQGPMCAIVVDPDRTVSSGKVDIGAFRTYADDYTPATSTGGGDQTIPLTKAEDFGAHASRYYPLKVEHFRSTLDGKLLDLLWNKYWVQTLAQNPLLTNRDFASSQMVDLASKMGEVANGITRNAGRSIERQMAASTATAGSSGGGGGGAAAAAAAAAQAAASPAPAQFSSKSQQNLERIMGDISQVATKERAGLMAAEAKASLFGDRSCGCRGKPAQ
ncbi:putative COP9 signalosome complex subunit 5 [Podospora australis]|uniref:COP9 signalosome complex subunit 5 n=1 Tax=Podospora australis TaxID=1536484 RepID=A0AAN7AJJ9_9PEZI|nr:putative COP9 signalosome complex subunit 5 [Podospora australis]